MASASSKPPEAGRGRPPRALNVVREGGEALLEPVDWSHWYLTDEDDMGESCTQSVVSRMLLSVFAVLLRERGGPQGFLSHDNFFAWREDQPLVRVSPDVYFIEGEVPKPLPAMWQTWRPGHRPPKLAFEIVSSEWQKDYDDAPQKYAQLGVEELVIFDPEAARGATRNEQRVPLQIYRRGADDSFVRLPLESRHLETFDIFLAIDSGGETPLLRLVRDEAGRELVSTLEEVVTREAQRAEQEAQRAEQEAQRAEQEAQRAEQEAQRAEESERALAAALAEIERLRGLLPADD